MTESEIIRAQAQAEKDAADIGLLLLLAFIRKDSQTAKRVYFDQQKGRFVVNGRTVSIRSIAKYLDRTNEKMARRLLLITKELEAGRMSIDEWKRNFDSTVTSTHILFGALAVGGIVNAIRKPSMIHAIDEQLTFADKFAEAIRHNNAGSPAQIRARALKYLNSSRIIFAKLELEQVIAQGIRKEARNLLRPAEHCFRSPLASPNVRIDCPTLSEWGWIPVEQMIPVGERICRFNCRCMIIYR